MKKKFILKVTSLALMGLMLFNTIGCPVYASEVDTTTDDLDSVVNDNSEIGIYLGGGPSPSAAWTKSGTYKVKYTAKQVKNMAYMAKKATSVGKVGDAAYKITCEFMSLLTGKIAGATGYIAGKYLGYVAAVDTYGNMTVRSYNVLSKAAAANRSVTVTYQRYVRPATNTDCLAEAISWK
ncbi:hypothetical protein [Terrisporobacter vanillatitrophus]|uniref:hypothetical protein n=1 Tax=Terrisporobacter vanillatitrophus TaxID=3058402 RepID=UPI003368C33B